METSNHQSVSTTGDTVAKKRYLLFDSGCSECTEIARSVEQEAGDWLTARSLGDSDIQALLSNARPDWKWEPTLLEIDGEKPQAFTGLTMKTRMLAGLGLRRAIRVAKITDRPKTYKAEIKETDSGTALELRPMGRSEALKAFAAFGVAAMVPGALLPTAASAKSGKVAGNSPKLAIRELSKERLQKLAEKISRDNEGGMLWERLTREGFTANLEDAVGVVINPLSPTPKNSGKKTLRVYIPFSNDKGRQAGLSFSKIASHKETSAAIFQQMEDGDEVFQAMALEVSRGQVHVQTVEYPASSSPPLFQAASACSSCLRGYSYVIGLPCGLLGAVACVGSCTAFTFGVGAPICGVLCSVVFASVCIYGNNITGAEACARYC